MTCDMLCDMLMSASDVLSQQFVDSLHRSSFTFTMPPLVPQIQPDLKRIVKYPNNPDTPPTNKDMATAIIFFQEVFAARRLSYRGFYADNH